MILLFFIIIELYNIIKLFYCFSESHKTTSPDTSSSTKEPKTAALKTENTDGGEISTLLPIVCRA